MKPSVAMIVRTLTSCSGSTIQSSHSVNYAESVKWRSQSASVRDLNQAKAGGRLNILTVMIRGGHYALPVFFVLHNL